MPFVRARGVRFHVVDLGRETGVGRETDLGRETGLGTGAGQGRGAAAEPLVMLHGLFTGSAASWFFSVAPELARTRPVRLPDWRGHGMSERTATGYDTATMTADLAELTAGLPPFAIAGHSYGAVVAVRFARSHPGRVTRMALIDPPFGGEFLHRGEPAVATPIAATPAGDALCGQTSVLADLAAERAVTGAELAALGDLPVLAVVGADSPYRPAGDLVGGALPASRRHVLPGGHDLHITARARLAPLLESFLTGTEETHA
ncbi:alpha/beta fold hydrolase [Actinomadura sp. 9N407]|uniref:alpha/beta fold hydrolase n=1 Tax=Actinomadura sp. 9N407 TaxID=3375154 RepID=UPI00379CD721